ncbi:unnamed protein product, partial [Pararhodospirillum photometricum DSM 122]
RFPGSLCPAPRQLRGLAPGRDLGRRLCRDHQVGANPRERGGASPARPFSALPACPGAETLCVLVPVRATMDEAPWFSPDLGRQMSVVDDFSRPSPFRPFPRPGRRHRRPGHSCLDELAPPRLARRCRAVRRCPCPGPGAGVGSRPHRLV